MHAGLLEIAFELAAHDVVRRQRPDRLDDLQLLGDQVVRILPGRGLHGQKDHDVQQMVLDDVADAARLVVEPAPPVDAEILRHRYLHALHVIPVPDRFRPGIGEAEIEKVLYRLLSDEMVDAEDGLFVEDEVKDPIEPTGRGQVAAKGLFDHQSRVAGGLGLFEALDDRLEHARRNGEVIERTAPFAERVPKLLECRLVAIVAADVVHQPGKLVEHLVVDLADGLLDAVAGPLAQLVDGPVVERHADHRLVQGAAPDHGVERGKDLLVRQVSCRAEKDERVRTGWLHLLLLVLFLDVTAEGIAHRGEEPVGKLGFATRGEALEERRRKDRDRYAGVDRSLYRPAALA